MHTAESRLTALHRLRGKLEHLCHPFGLSDKRFDETHELFERSSNQQQLILEWLKGLIWPNYASLDPLRILSVGCGSGILDNPLIKIIASKSKRLEYTGVDPNTVACQRFRDEFDNLKLFNVRLDLREEKIESLTSTGRFDLILVIHSLYYFDNPATTLDRLLRLCAPEGKVVIVQAPEAELNQLAKCFWTHHAENDICFSDCLADHLLQRRLAFSRQRIHGEVDVTSCFETDCSIGEMMLDFITQCDCQQLGDDILQLCLSYLRAISRQEKDSMLVAHPADAFVIA